MRKEFSFWIITAIERRCSDINQPLNPEQRQDLLKVINQHSNDDYETVSDTLKNSIEDRLTLYGYSIQHAIRFSWKWSD